MKIELPDEYNLATDHRLISEVSMEPILYLIALFVLLICWIFGESQDMPTLRRICGPLFAAMLAGAVAGYAVLDTTFQDSIRYSGATKRFVSALIDAIDQGDAELAHSELRRFDKESIETYEGGMLLEWLEEPVGRLKASRDPNRSGSP
ncbi:MAG: hypothetical protein AAF664_12890 [Planctomycetota bacterium]